MRRTDVDSPRQRHLASDGHDWSVWEWSGPGRPLLFVHATGFHANCWRRVIEFFPGRRVVAVDMPNHGQSERQPVPFSLPSFARGLAGVLDQLGLEEVTATGHSMGGHVTTLVAALRPQMFRGLVLVDPVVLSPGVAERREQEGGLPPEENPVARRRRYWESPEQMIEAFSKRQPFRDWDPAVLQDYCRFGLLPRSDEPGYELACLPLHEAHVYASGVSRAVYEAINQVDIPVQVIRGKPWHDNVAPGDFSHSPTWPKLASQFRHGIDDFHPERTHFFPMETPQWLAERIHQFEQRTLESHGLEAPK